MKPLRNVARNKLLQILQYYNTEALHKQNYSNKLKEIYNMLKNFPFVCQNVCSQNLKKTFLKR